MHVALCHCVHVWRSHTTACRLASLRYTFAAESKADAGAYWRWTAKSNEIPAFPELLELVGVKGCTVTADALHAQRGTAAAIVAKGGDYTLALKGNRGTLHADVAEYAQPPDRSVHLPKIGRTPVR